MPVLDSNIVDLKQDKAFNESRRLSAGVVMELADMPEEARSATMNRALSAKQQAEAESFINDLEKSPLPAGLGAFGTGLTRWKDSLTKAMQPNFNLPAMDYETVSTQPEPTTRKRNRTAVHAMKYDSVGKLVYIDAYPALILSNAHMQAAAIELVYNHKLVFRELVSYHLIFKNGTLSEELRREDIKYTGQLRTAMYDLNKKINELTGEDFFIGRGGVQRNPRFHLITL